MNNVPTKENPVLLDTHEDTLQEAIEAADEQQLAEIVDSVSSQEALRRASLMKADDRDQLISILCVVSRLMLVSHNFSTGLNILKNLVPGFFLYTVRLNKRMHYSNVLPMRDGQRTCYKW